MRNTNWERHALMLLLVMVTGGCTNQPKHSGYFATDRAHLAEADDLGWLLLRAGLEPEAWPAGQGLTVQKAQELRAWIQQVALPDGHMASYGPRKTVEFLLEEVIAGGQPVDRTTLNQRLSRFHGRVVLRPDAYIAEALRGTPLASAGRLRVEKGSIVAANLKLGTFYMPEGTSFREDPVLVIRRSLLSGAQLSTTTDP